MAEPGTHPIPAPEHAWALILGTGYRGTFEQLDLEGREYIRQANLNFMRDSGVPSVEVNVLYAVATRP